MKEPHTPPPRCRDTSSFVCEIVANHKNPTPAEVVLPDFWFRGCWLTFIEEKVWTEQRLIISKPELLLQSCATARCADSSKLELRLDHKPPESTRSEVGFSRANLQ